LAALGILGAALVAPPALAQLTAEDIAALRARGEREGWTFTVGENEATHYSLEQLCGVVEPRDWRLYGRFDPCTPRRDLPATYDWRTQGVCTPIRNQANCGSCWAFGLIGAVESNIAIEDQALVDLSEQWLVSCCGLGGCSGEWPGNAANFLLCDGVHHDYCGGYGAVMEAAFPYQAWDAPCNCPYEHPYCLTSWAYIGPQWDVPTVSQLKQAILDHGPVTVCVNASSAFMGYNGGVFNACDSSAINHAVALVGWDDSQGPSGVWFLRNSWGASWGESGYMRITYGCCLVGYGALYVDYPGLPPALVFSYPDGQPQEMPVNQPKTFHVDVSGKYDGVPVPASGQLHYSLNNGTWTTVPMTEISSNHYEATLPAASCMDKYRWYTSALEASVGRLYDPSDAPAHYYSTLAIAYRDTVFADNFQTDKGWQVQNVSLINGAWERGVPAGAGDRGDPTTDYDGSGACFVTGNCLGDCDLDGGPTRLISPTFNLSDGRPYQAGYARWFTNDNHDVDRLTVEVSNNNGASWVVVETVPNTVGWVYRTFNVADFVTPSAQVRVRFSAVDNPSNSITEAGIDAFSMSALVCTPPHLGDVNCDGSTNFADINPFVLALSSPDAYAQQFPGCPLENRDINMDGVLNFGDINAFVALLSGDR
jgi:hypothetical protein